MTIKRYFYVEILCACSKDFFIFFLVDLFTALEERTFVSRMLWSRFRFRTDWNPQDFVQVNFYTFLAATVRARLGFFLNFRFRDVFLWLIFVLFFKKKFLDILYTSFAESHFFPCQFVHVFSTFCKFPARIWSQLYQKQQFVSNTIWERFCFGVDLKPPQFVREPFKFHARNS